MFVTQIAGAKPAYMENVIKEARQMPKREAPQRQEWDQAYVKKLLSYYFEDKDGNELESKWKEGAPNAKEVKAAVDTMLEIGFTNRAKCDLVADAICELLQRRCLNWTQLDRTLSGQLESLEELKLDTPFCDLFVHSLLARLFQAFCRDFNPMILTHFPQEVNEFTWNLLCGALKTLKDSQGSDAVRKALDHVPQLADTLCKVRVTKMADMKKALQE